MIDKLDFLVRFWELEARNASLGEPLVARERIELLSLMQLVTGERHERLVPPVGPVERPKNPLPAQMIGDGTILAVEVRVVNAAAIIVSCASSMPVGAQVILRAADAISGVEYTLPCKVLWTYRSAPAPATTFVALAVDGIPTRAVFVETPEPRLAMPLPLGKHARLIG